MAGNLELSGFVREALNRGTSRHEIRAVLDKAGWPESEITAALDSFAEVDFPMAVPKPKVSLSAREAFEYFVFFGTLYLCAFSLGRLLFQFVNLAFPDPRWNEYQLNAIPEAIRWSIASLVVSTPVFLYSARRKAIELERDTTKRKSPVRRWLTYLTLAITGSLLVGDTTSLVYSLLAGELAPRFVLKALVIAAIAGTAFYYFLTDLRRDETRDSTQ